MMMMDAMDVSGGAPGPLHGQPPHAWSRPMHGGYPTPSGWHTAAQLASGRDFEMATCTAAPGVQAALPSRPPSGIPPATLAFPAGYAVQPLLHSTCRSDAAGELPPLKRICLGLGPLGPVLGGGGHLDREAVAAARSKRTWAMAFH
mmetsp:Transcript_50058/g.155183  ORF Transcript_50058/g.155183 Transcript_50058/m.155183 type:complete len:146 (+) Transcript_50058:72-509(+)